MSTVPTCPTLCPSNKRADRHAIARHYIKCTCGMSMILGWVPVFLLVCYTSVHVHVLLLPSTTYICVYMYSYPKLLAHVLYACTCIYIYIYWHLHVSFSNMYHSHTERLAYDWISDKIYWSDYGAAEIGIVDFQTDIRMVLIQTGQPQLSRPRALALDPTTRWVSVNKEYSQRNLSYVWKKRCCGVLIV